MTIASLLKPTICSFFILSMTLLSGCKEEITVVKNRETSINQYIYPQSYVSKYYFVDTLYRQFWAPLHESISPELTPEMYDNMIIQLELFRSIPPPSGVGKFFKGRAYTDLPARFSTENYPSTVEQSLGGMPGQKYSGIFVKLNEGSDYNYFDGVKQMVAGYIILNIEIPDAQALAVTYTVFGDGLPRAYGTMNGSYRDTTADGFYLLKLIKPPGLQWNPGYKPAWDLQLRNIYSLGGPWLNPSEATLRVFRQTETIDVDQINGENLLTVLGLDRYNTLSDREPDHVFDYIPGLTLDTERGELIFPTLRPFDSGITEYFAKLGKPPPNDSLLFNDIYDTTYTAARNNTVKNRYIIRITRHVPDP